MTIEEIAAKAAAFQSRLDETRARLAPGAYGWYRYDSLGNFFTLAAMLTGDRRRLLDLTAGMPVLDIGCADGDMALFLDSLGCAVHAVDNPDTNCNRMEGIRALTHAMSSGVEIFERDIDDDPRPPAERYGLILLLGVLYHVKNPFRLLESLSRHGRYLLLSTRVARLAADRKTPLSHIPVAYLAGDSETNNDVTNYWIFSPTGLERILARTGWRVLDSLSVGNTAASDPATEEGDERMFVLAENNRQPAAGGRMLHGWHTQEGWQTWRWTERRFSAEWARSGRMLILNAYVPDAMAGVTLSARVNGVDLERARFDSPGDAKYTAPSPAGMKPPLLVEFELDKIHTPGNGDERELGLVVGEVRIA